ncbi:MAG: phospholipase, partial [Proteobacteria bacterium]|nr:phospholipase [Pseudomonadota bacterium]
GLVDYHINQDYSTRDRGLTLFFHHQERIIPGWLDKKLKRRRPPGAFLDSVVMVYPSQEFIAGLPGGRIPDRGDFATFIDDPATRIANWRRAVELAEPLGEEFLELIASGRLKDVVEKL